MSIRRVLGNINKSNIIQQAIKNNMNVRLHQMSRADISDVRDSIRSRQVTPKPRDVRPFSQHNIVRQPTTKDFPARFSLGDMDAVCHLFYFKNETDFNCCQNGKVAYDPPTNFPMELQAYRIH